MLRSSETDRVKDGILKVYEVTPEYYRIKFRATRMHQGVRYTKFAHSVRKLEIKWMRSLGDEMYEAVLDAILMDHLLQQVLTEVRMYVPLREDNSDAEGGWCYGGR